MIISFEIKPDEWATFQYLHRDKDSERDQQTLAGLIAHLAILKHIERELSDGPFVVRGTNVTNFWIYRKGTNNPDQLIEDAVPYTQYTNAARACKKMNRQYHLDMMKGKVHD